MSALDLYSMGLIGPEEVSDTFLLADPKPLGDDVFSGTKVPVRIADIIQASGARQPAAADSQREFKLGMYLLYDGAQPRPEKLAQARAIEKALAQYFDVATQGRMKLVIQRRAPALATRR